MWFRQIGERLVHFRWAQRDDKASAIAHKANDEGAGLRDAALALGVSAADFDRIVDVNVRVDAPAGERLLVLGEINRAVDFDRDTSVSGVRQKVDSDEIRADGPRCIDSECSRLRCRSGQRGGVADRDVARRSFSAGEQHATAAD